MKQVIVIMGVSGCGKTTIGRSLSKELGLPFYDADDFHPKSNIAKMAKGISLNDADRFPWLVLLANNIQQWKQDKGAILACSALKEVYREILSSGSNEIVWVYLSGSPNLIKERIENRNAHFMSSDLLVSQFNTLEVPDYGLHVDIDKSAEEIVKEIKLRIDGE